jgi:hypothetical protein
MVASPQLRDAYVTHVKSLQGAQRLNSTLRSILELPGDTLNVRMVHISGVRTTWLAGWNRLPVFGRLSSGDAARVATRPRQSRQWAMRSTRGPRMSRT